MIGYLDLVDLPIADRRSAALLMTAAHHHLVTGLVADSVDPNFAAVDCLDCLEIAGFDRRYFVVAVLAALRALNYLWLQLS